MTALKNKPSILPSRSDLFYFLVGMICTAGVWATAPVDVIWGQTQPDQKSPTLVEGDVRGGKVLFTRHCVTCHGPKGQGDGLQIAGATVADLSSPATQRKLNVDLLTTIHEGRPGRVMPSWEYRLSKEQTRDVLAYIRTLRRK